MAACFDQLSARGIAAGVAAGDFTATEVARAALDAVDASFLMTYDDALRRHVGDFCITAEEGLELLAKLDG